MAKFEIGTSIKGREPRVTVDAGLPVGRHRFHLQVVCADGRESEPDVVEVDIQRTILRPPDDPVIRSPIRPEGDPPLVNPNLINPAITVRPRITRKTRSKK